MEGIVESMDPRSLRKTRGEMPRELETYLDSQVKTLLSLIRELRSTYTTAANGENIVASKVNVIFSLGSV